MLHTTLEMLQMLHHLRRVTKLHYRPRLVQELLELLGDQLHFSKLLEQAFQHQSQSLQE